MKILIAFILCAAACCYAQTDNVYYPLACGAGSPPSWCNGSELGGWTNAAIAAAATNHGRVVISFSGTSSCHSFSTPIVDSTGVSISGDSKNATCIQYTPTTGTAITFDGGGDSSSVAGFGLRDIHLAGPGGSNTATGLLVATPGFGMTNVEIGGFVNSGQAGFHIGQTFGNNSYLDRFVTSQIWTNDQDVLYPAGLSDSGENIAYIHTGISNGNTFTNCAEIGTGSMQGQSFTFDGVSFDHCQLVNNDNIVRITHSHFEDLASIDAPFVVTYGDAYDGFYGLAGTTISGSDVWIDNGVSANGLFEVDDYGFLSIRDMFVAPSSTPPLVYLWGDTQGGTPLLKIDSFSLPQTAAQLYSVASGTSAKLSIRTLNVTVGP